MSALIFKKVTQLIFAFTPAYTYNPCAQTQNGNKLAPNNGRNQNFAIDADKNKILFKAIVFQSSFRGMKDIYLHFKAEETEVTPLAH